MSYVVSGSVAARLHGVDLRPGDLDVVPDTSRANLARLIRALVELEATPDGFGYWTSDERGERKFVVLPVTRAALAAWQPDPDDPASIDHLFRTRLGNLDVVPELTGTYRELAARAKRRRVGARRVRVAHVDDLLAKLTVPRRDKDVARVAGLRAIQRGRTGGSRRAGRTRPR